MMGVKRLIGWLPHPPAMSDKRERPGGWSARLRSDHLNYRVTRDRFATYRLTIMSLALQNHIRKITNRAASMRHARVKNLSEKNLAPWLFDDAYSWLSTNKTHKNVTLGVIRKSYPCVELYCTKKTQLCMHSIRKGKWYTYMILSTPLPPITPGSSKKHGVSVTIWPCEVVSKLGTDSVTVDSALQWLSLSLRGETKVKIFNTYCTTTVLIAIGGGVQE